VATDRLQLGGDSCVHACWPVEVRELELIVAAGQLSGTAKLEANDGQRGFDATFRGELGFDDKHKRIRFNLLVAGNFWGTGPHTMKLPSGKFPLVISFTLADGTHLGDAIPPHASRGWLEGYLFPHR